MKKLQEARGKSGCLDSSLLNGGATRPRDLCYAEKPLWDESTTDRDLFLSPAAMMDSGLVEGHTTLDEVTTKKFQNP